MSPTRSAPIRSTKCSCPPATSCSCRATRDFNGGAQDGVGLYQVTQKNGERWSAARAYLPPEARARPNLHIATGTRGAARGAGRPARHGRGVPPGQGGGDDRARARAVILSAGAFQSPQLLMLSGIGPAAELKSQGIAVAHDLPGVGRNLQDHLDFTLLYKASSPHLFGFTPAGLCRLPHAIRQWRRDRRGLFTTNFAESGGFLKTDPALPRPDIQLHFVVGRGRRPRAQAPFLPPATACTPACCGPRAAARSASPVPTR